MKTKIKMLDGFRSNGDSIEKCKITARYTSDDKGEILSLTDEKIQLTINFRELKKMIGGNKNVQM